MTDETSPIEQHSAETDATDEAAGDKVEVRRNVVLSVVVGALSAVLTVAFALRALGGGGTLDWAAFAVLGVITVLHLAAVVDGRAPLLVADRLGVRLRQGATWQGMTWDGIECLEHLPRRRLVRDGHLLVVGRDGEQLIVPLTLATRLVGAERATLSDELAALADGRSDVVEVVPGLEDDPEDAAEDTVKLERIAPRRDEAADGTALEAEDRGDEADTVDSIEPVDADAPTDEIAAVDGRDPDLPPPPPGRPVIAPARVEVHRSSGPGPVDRHHTGAHPTVGANALRAEVVQEPAQAEQTLTVVLDDLAVRPAPDPVIGRQLEAARERLRLTVDQLSERTRIRPHVIEAIEVDDFGPCGGDFYARGHLRTLSRVLGIDAGPLVATYDEKYADAPIDPRRVFESELATGVGGSIRGTRGGRNWSVLVAAIMAAVLVWSIARLVMDGPVEVSDPPVLNQSGGLSKPAKQAAVPVTLSAVGGGAKVVVRDGSGDIVFNGPLAFGQSAELELVPPVRVSSTDGSVTVSIDGGDPEPLGETGQEVTKAIPVS